MKLSEFVPSEAIVNNVANVVERGGIPPDHPMLVFNEQFAEMLAYAAQLKQERDALARQVEALQRELAAAAK